MSAPAGGGVVTRDGGMAYYWAVVRRMLPIVAAAVVLVAGGGAFLAVRTPSPEQVATRLLHARYVNDAAAVYELASAADRRWRTLEQHLASHPRFPAEFQELVGELGEFIEIRGVESDLQDGGGTVTVHGTVPNANHAEVRDLLYGDGAAAGSPLDERRAELRRRGRAGTLPLIEYSQPVELVREGEHWKAFLDWAVGYTIHFRAEVREELPFEFSAEPESITLKPGETGSAVFYARNVSDATVKAKAGPPARSAGGVPAHRAGAVLLLLRGHLCAGGGARVAGGVAPRLGHTPGPGRDHHAVRVLPAGAIRGPAARGCARRVAATRRQGGQG